MFLKLSTNTQDNVGSQVNDAGITLSIAYTIFNLHH